MTILLRKKKRSRHKPAPYIRTFNNSKTGQSQILCKHRNWCKIEQKYLRGGSCESGFRLAYKISVLRGHVKGGGRRPPFILTLDRPLCSWLLRHTIREIDRHLGMNDTPILPASSPFFRNVHHGQIQHLEKAVIRRENRFGLCDLS